MKKADECGMQTTARDHRDGAIYSAIVRWVSVAKQKDPLTRERKRSESFLSRDFPADWPPRLPIHDSLINRSSQVKETVAHLT